MNTPIQLSERIVVDSMGPNLLDDLRKAVSQPEIADAIVAALLLRFGTSSNALDAVVAVMDRFEVIAESYAEVGSCLMAHLWGAASQIDGAFDVTDAIDLWIANTNAASLDVQIQYLSDKSREPHIREHFRSVIRM